MTAMALAGRSARRGGTGFRWVAAGVIITLLILLIDASLNSRSPAPVQDLAAGAWVDRVLPVVAASNSEGQVIDGVWVNGLHMAPNSVLASLDQVAAGAAANYQAVSRLRPPAELSGPAGLLEAALFARSKAATNLKQAIGATLAAAATSPAPAPGAIPPAGSAGSASAITPPAGSATAITAPAGSATATATTAGVPGLTTVPPGSTTTTLSPTGSLPPATLPPPVAAGPPSPQVASISSAGSEIQLGDQAYNLFLTSFPPAVGIKFPSSVWGADMGPYAPQTASVFLASLQSSAAATPLHQVKIYAITTNPAPVSMSGPTQVLPDATAMTLTIVVADTGNQAESNLTVVAAISPAGGGSSSVRDFVNLNPGQAYTINALGPLNPPQGVPVTLTVTVTAPAGSATPQATAGFIFEEPAPPPPSTTTTTTSATTTTTPTVRTSITPSTPPST